MRAGPLLDVAANSQEELKEWMVKIREVTMTSEAKVKTCVEQLPDQDTLLAGRLLNLYLRNTGWAVCQYGAILHTLTKYKLRSNVC